MAPPRTMQSTSFWASATFAAVTVAAATACSVLNAFDAVKPELDASAPDTGTDAPADAGAADVAAEAGPAKGAIVVGGLAKDDAGQIAVLTALAPETGIELPMARQKLLVASVQYDGLRDLWYVFESNGATHFPTPSDAVFLHIRRLDTQTGAWEEIQSIKVPTLVANTHIAVLRDRLVYVAYRSEPDGAFGTALAVVDTSNPSQPSVVGSSTPLAKEPIGLIGTRSSTSAGGSITLLYTRVTGPLDDGGGACGGDAGASCLEVQHVIVAGEAAPSIGPFQAVGVFTGTPAFGSFLGKGTPIDYIGFTAAPPNGSLQGYLPSNGSPIGTPIPFSINDAFLKPIAFADCLGQALVIGTNTETAVNAIPVAAAGSGDRGVMQHSGQSVHFEPFTSTVLAPFTQGNGYELTAFELTGTASAPKLTLRQAPQWTPPSDLRPEIVATRTPLPFTCP